MERCWVRKLQVATFRWIEFPGSSKKKGYFKVPGPFKQTLATEAGVSIRNDDKLGWAPAFDWWIGPASATYLLQGNRATLGGLVSHGVAVRINMDSDCLHMTWNALHKQSQSNSKLNKKQI